MILIFLWLFGFFRFALILGCRVVLCLELGGVFFFL